MRIATLLFTYNRPNHTEKVLETLRNNYIVPEKLFIFHDGMKSNTDEKEWGKVEKVIRDVKWCDCEVRTASQNMGLANSIIKGVGEVIRDYDAVVVLEDDCITHRMFMSYMTGALEKYLDKKDVYCINATADPVNAPSNGFDAYFSGRIRSTGWATWKDRWACFCKDYELIGRIKGNSELNDWLNIWGQDLEATLHSNMLGKVDSWAIFWALNVIERKGLALTPFHSLIDNIGFDYTGVHSGGIKPDLRLMDAGQTNISLPDDVSVIPNYTKIYAWYFPWIDPAKRDKYYKDILLKYCDFERFGAEIIDWFSINGIRRISLWGLGDVGKALFPYLQERMVIESIIETNPRIDKYADVHVVSPNEINWDVDCILVIPGYDITRIRMIAGEENERRLVTVEQVLEPAIPSWSANNKYQNSIRRYGDE